MSENPFPSNHGTYLIHYHLLCAQSIQIGKLGKFDFPAGEYLYFGNAHGSGGLAARLRHHLKISPKPHWHIDWLRLHAQPVGVIYAGTDKGCECDWQRIIRTELSGGIIAPGFGASDCRSKCGTHLLYFADGVELGEVGALLEEFGFCDVASTQFKLLD